MPWLRYRTIRSQLTLGFIALELLFTLCFSLMILRTESQEIHARAQRRIEQQTLLLSTIASDAMLDEDRHRLGPLIRAVRSSSFVRSVRLTDPQGQPLSHAPSLLETAPLSASEQRELPLLSSEPRRAHIFQNEAGVREGVRAIEGPGTGGAPHLLG